MGGPSHESVLDRVIREAMERGKFDDLPHRGRPLPPRDERAGEWTTAFEMLREAGMAPPWIEADKEARRLLAERDDLLRRARTAGPLMRGRYRAEMTALVRRYNDAVAALAADAPTHRQHRPRLVERIELDALERAWSAEDR